MGTSKAFDEWIARVEARDITAPGPGLLAASLGFRTALREAFKAGQQAEFLKWIDKMEDK